MVSTDTLLEVKGLTKHFALHSDVYSKLAGEKAQLLKAVDGIDFHVDESEDPAARSLPRIAETAMRLRFPGRIVVGHCCSLALQSDSADTIAKLRDANIAVVSLPLCNMYLQDRHAGRTPRWRGVTPLKEMRAAGVAVAVASDNTRDPFYAYGDLDLVEVFRESVRIVQLDHPIAGWADIVAAARGYHGRTLGALAATWDPSHREHVGPLPPGFRHIPYNKREALEAALSDDTAAVLLEMVQGEGGVREHEAHRRVVDADEGPVDGVSLLGDQLAPDEDHHQPGHDQHRDQGGEAHGEGLGEGERPEEPPRLTGEGEDG